jgi:hypothetical protein
MTNPTPPAAPDIAGNVWTETESGPYEHDATSSREIRRLRVAVKELADELEAEIRARYPETTLAYPSEKRRHDRDMEPVHRARELLDPREAALTEIVRLAQEDGLYE